MPQALYGIATVSLENDRVLILGGARQDRLLSLSTFILDL